MKPFWVVFLLYLFVNQGFAQRKAISQLQSQLKEASLNPSRRADLQNQIAWAYCTVQTDSAMYWAKTNLAYTQTNKLPLAHCMSLRIQGRCKLIKGRYAEAYADLFDALTQAENLHDSLQIGYCYRYLAGTFAETALFDKSFDYFSRAEQIFRKLHAERELANCLDNIGSVKMYLGRDREALHIFEEALALNQKNRESLGVAYSMLNYGAAALKTGQVAQGEVMLNKAKQLLENEQDVYFINICKYYLSRLYQAKSKPRESIKMATEALNQASVHGPKYIPNLASLVIYQDYEAQHDLPHALEYFKIHKAYQDTLTKNITLNSFEIKYETKKKADEILALKDEQRRSNTQKAWYLSGFLVVLCLAGLLFYLNRQLEKRKREVERQRAEISAQNNKILEVQQQLKDFNSSLETRINDRTQELLQANNELLQKNEEIKQALLKGQTIERKRVAAELHDSLGGTLGAIKFNMEMFDTQHLNPEEKGIYRDVLGMIREAYRDLRLISHNLLPQELEQEGLQAGIERLAGQLNNAHKIRFDVSCAALPENLNQEVTFNLYNICSELLNNILKHSQATEAKISLNKVGNQLVLQVVDNGRGFSNLGNHSQGGVGLRNVIERVECLKGSCHFAPSQPQGMTALIKVPIA